MPSFYFKVLITFWHIPLFIVFMSFVKVRIPFLAVKDIFKYIYKKYWFFKLVSTFSPNSYPNIKLVNECLYTHSEYLSHNHN